MHPGLLLDACGIVNTGSKLGQEASLWTCAILSAGCVPGLILQVLQSCATLHPGTLNPEAAGTKSASQLTTSTARHHQGWRYSCIPIRRTAAGAAFLGLGLSSDPVGSGHAGLGPSPHSLALLWLLEAHEATVLRKDVQAQFCVCGSCQLQECFGPSSVCAARACRKGAGWGDCAL